MQTMHGGCACGAIRYSINATPSFAFHCQCRQCQRASGGGHASLFIAPKATVTLQGAVKYYVQTADDGTQVSRGFCPHCGSPVIGMTSAHTENYLFTAASLDDPALFKPQKLLFGECAQPWDFIQLR